MSRSDYDYEVNFDYDKPDHYERAMTEFELVLEADIEALEHGPATAVHLEPPAWWAAQDAAAWAKYEADNARLADLSAEAMPCALLAPATPEPLEGAGFGPPPLTDDDVDF